MKITKDDLAYFGRAFFDSMVEDGKTEKEALRIIVDVVKRDEARLDKQVFEFMQTDFFPNNHPSK